MPNKLYETIKKYVKKEYKFIISLVVILLVFTIKLPYYIDMPGGIINITDRIKIDEKNIYKMCTISSCYKKSLKLTTIKFIKFSLYGLI